METKELGIITVDKMMKQKIKCRKFYCTDIKRTLMIHEDIENKNYTSVSDDKTGFKLFSIPQKLSLVKENQISERLAQFIKHFELPAIAEEFKRIENLPQPERKKK